MKSPWSHRFSHDKSPVRAPSVPSARWNSSMDLVAALVLSWPELSGTQMDKWIQMVQKIITPNCQSLNFEGVRKNHSS